MGMNPQTSLATHRRSFLKGVTAGALGVAGSHWLSSPLMAAAKPQYRGPNVILIRFGGGTRPAEAVNPDPNKNFAPYFYNVLAKRGTLFKNMMIDSFTPTVGVDTSHGQGTMYLLTGKYEKLKGVSHDPDFKKKHPAVDLQLFDDRFESKVPNFFEYFRKSFDVPSHQSLIINSEDRNNEEFYTYSLHAGWGIDYKCEALSLYRYKTWLLRQKIAEGKWKDKELEKKKMELAKLEKIDFRREEAQGQIPELKRFWERWRAYYGDTGFVNPRGDRLLTELSIRAMKEIRPKLMMINFQDCDYVHWGIASQYTRAVAIMDEGLKQIVAACDADEEYRDNTIFVVVPDCGRDNNSLCDVPFQHHFNTKAAHEIFCLIAGPKRFVAQGKLIKSAVDQIQVASTVGQLMGFKSEHAENTLLAPAFA